MASWPRLLQGRSSPPELNPEEKISDKRHYCLECLRVSTRLIYNDRAGGFSIFQFCFHFHFCHKPTVSPLIMPLLYCYINGLQRASSMGKPWPGGENRMD